jgi:hypothetical protein
MERVASHPRDFTLAGGAPRIEKVPSELIETVEDDIDDAGEVYQRGWLLLMTRWVIHAILKAGCWLRILIRILKCLIKTLIGVLGAR